MTEANRHDDGFPGEALFKQNGRSAKLREIGLAMANAMYRLLHDISIVDDLDVRQILQEQIESYKQQLRDLGIEPYMHVGRKDDTSKAGVVDIAEFVADQLIMSPRAEDRSETEMMRLIGEYSETELVTPLGEVSVLGTTGSPPALIEYFGLRDIINKTYLFLDADDNEIHP